MKAGRFFVSALTVLALGIASTGCQKETEKEEAQKLEKEGKDRLQSRESSINDLRTNYKVDLQQFDVDNNIAKYEWPSDRAKVVLIKRKINNHLKNNGRILEIVHHKNIIAKGSTFMIELERKNGTAYLKGGDAFEQTTFGSVSKY